MTWRPDPGGGVTSEVPLQRFLRSRPTSPPGSVCEMCTEPIGGEHPHLVDVESRKLMCTCRACHLLFTADGAGGGRFRVVGDRYLHDPDFQLTSERWDALQIPVGMAFFFHNSKRGETVALYPSPAGATESTLPLDAWSEIEDTNPLVASMEPDVEALLVRRSEAGFESFVVPIDACYELVGLVRTHWKGFDGGTEVWRELDAFFERLRSRAGSHG